MQHSKVAYLQFNLKMDKQAPTFVYKRPLNYFNSIILNENYPMQIPTYLQIVAYLSKLWYYVLGV